MNIPAAGQNRLRVQSQVGCLRLEVAGDHDARAAGAAELQAAHALKIDPRAAGDVGPQGMVHGPSVADRLIRVGWVRTEGGLIYKRDVIFRNDITPFLIRDVQP